LPEPKPDAPPRGVGAALAVEKERIRRSLLRNHGGGRASVSNLELFFDLVFVFAVTQLSHLLLGHPTLEGALQTALLFFAVWWAWIFTTWATNWIDPDRGPNRAVIGLIMLTSLVMACALPNAFTSQAGLFVGTYVALQVGRTAWTAYAMGEARGERHHNLTRATLYFCLSGLLWATGALADGFWPRFSWWLAALVIEYLGPITFFWVPGLGRSRPADWAISGSHMAERCSLFIIIALGEGLLITGATYAAAAPTRGIDAAFVNAFLGSFAMWWLYFDLGAQRGAEHIEHHANPGAVARDAFTYWHIPIVAGVIVLAVIDELTLLDPFAPSHDDFVVMLGVGMALFIGGNGVFKRITSANRWYPLSHAVGLGLTALIALWGSLRHPPQLASAVAATIAFAIVALWEWGSFHGGWIERMEARGWWLGRVLRRRIERRRAEREARSVGS